MKEPIFFSVIIPLYNKEQYVGQTIKSVLNQTFEDYEIVVINDGSTDTSSDIVKSIVSDKIRLIEVENGGVAKARNIGILNSKGKYIAFLDADDVWKKSYLQNVYDLIKNNPECGFFCSKYEIRKKNKIILSNKIDKHGEIGKFWEILRYKYDVVWTSATVVEKNMLIEAGLFNIKDEVGEDLGLWLRVARLNSKVAFCPKVGVTYLRDTDNNARIRTKILYPSDFLEGLEIECSKDIYSKTELDSMRYKYDKKMYVYILSLIVSGQSYIAEKQLLKWNNYNFTVIKVILFVMCKIPNHLNRVIYKVIIERV